MDDKLFRRALGTFPTGVTVVTTRDEDGAPVGMTVASFNSVSLDPPLILWSLDRSAFSFQAFSTASHFCVHILAEDQVEMSDRFAQTLTDKFSDLETEPGIGGAPRLINCAARFDCAAWRTYDGGDHIIIIGQVEDMESSGKPPLLFAGGGYHALGAKIGAV